MGARSPIAAERLRLATHRARAAGFPPFLARPQRGVKALRPPQARAGRRSRSAKNPKLTRPKGLRVFNDHSICPWLLLYTPSCLTHDQSNLR